MQMQVFIPALFAAHTTSLSQYWHKITDPTFKGIYHANAFDLAMMIPYFIVLFVLALYGLAPLLAGVRLLCLLARMCPDRRPKLRRNGRV